MAGGPRWSTFRYPRSQYPLQKNPGYPSQYEYTAPTGQYYGIPLKKNESPYSLNYDTDNEVPTGSETRGSFGFVGDDNDDENPANTAKGKIDLLRRLVDGVDALYGNIKTASEDIMGYNRDDDTGLKTRGLFDNEGIGISYTYFIITLIFLIFR